MSISDTDQAMRHKARMARKKALIDAKIAGSQTQRGLLLVHTGNGKGKSSSAFGMVARALGHDMNVAIVQFIKGMDSTGEENFFRKQENVQFHVMGEGYTWDTQDQQRDIQKAELAWQKACEFLQDESIDMLVLDELNIALKCQYLNIDTVLSDILQRPAMQHVIVTGRSALPEMIEIADTVSEMKAIKHAFDDGVIAQKGIEL